MCPVPALDLFAELGGPASQMLREWLRVNNRTARPAEWLTGGHSQALVAAVMVEEPGAPTRKVIVKLCPPTSDDGPRESSRHRDALHRAPPPFARRHLVAPYYDAVPVPGGGLLVFQEIAEGSLNRLRPLEHVLDTQPEALDAACAAVVRSLLGEWNRETRPVVLTVREFLQACLVRRLRSGGSRPPWVADVTSMLPGAAPWVTLPGESSPLPNPLGLLFPTPLSTVLQERAVVGNSHGDLHLGNVLVPVEPKLNAAAYRLIDLAWYAPDAPLARDPQYLVVSIAARCLKDLSDPQREALIGCLVGTDPAGEAILPVWLRNTIVKLRRTTGTWAARDGLADEWAAQSRLALIAAALPWVGRNAIPADPVTSRRWFLRLAARAGGAYLQARGYSGAPARRHPAGPAVTAAATTPGDLQAAPAGVTDIELDPALSTAEHAGLEAILNGVSCPSAATLYEEATWPLGPRLGRGGSDLAAMVRQLVDVTGPPGGLPPLLVFVERLTGLVDDRVAAALRDWTAGFAARRGIDQHALGDVRAASRPARASQRTYLMVQVHKDLARPRRYLTAASLQSRSGRVESRWQTDEPQTLTRVKTRLDELVNDVLEDHGAEPGELVVEFFLPHALLDEPVDQWPYGAVQGFDSRLGVDHTVVVRSLERLGRRSWHQHWRHKWRWLNDHGDKAGSSAIHWLDHRGHDPVALRARFISNADTACVFLSFTPNSIKYRNDHEISVGISAGVPVLLWCRDRHSAGALKTEIGELLAGRNLHDLPERIRWLRQQAAQRTGGANHIGQHLTLVWDNPERVPAVSPRLQAPI